MFLTDVIIPFSKRKEGEQRRSHRPNYKEGHYKEGLIDQINVVPSIEDLVDADQ